MTSTHQFDPNRAPDSEFEPGQLEHLVAGREGRCLDPRRTPIRVVEVRSSTGTFVAEILEFEDKGATWEITFESVDHYQFSPLGVSASTDDIKLFEEAIERFDQSHFIEAEPAALESTNVAVAECQREATTWLETNSQFIAERDQLDFSTASMSCSRQSRVPAKWLASSRPSVTAF
ncbi:MAG: hypothetical protein GY811_17790 [Myxococcales bacterium]|nr:hypothetical protein [Myxococcales bacterium]